MSSGIFVAVKTKPYLKDWIIKKYGNGTEPVKATVSNKLFPLLAQYITTKPSDYKLPESTNDIILFELPYQNKEMNIRFRCFIHEDNFKDINGFFYGLFYSQFTLYMNRKCIDRKNRWRFKYAIYNYMDRNAISVDKLNYDSLKRIYLRYRKQYDDYDEREYNELPKKNQKK